MPDQLHDVIGYEDLMDAVRAMGVFERAEANTYVDPQGFMRWLAIVLRECGYSPLAVDRDLVTLVLAIFAVGLHLGREGK